MPAAKSIAEGNHRAKYQGKNLLRLLAALGSPVIVLYLGLMLSLGAGRAREVQRQQHWMIWGVYALSALFYVVQALCARYLQRSLPNARTRTGAIFQYILVFLLAIGVSILVATSLVAFGDEFALRSGAWKR